MYTQIKSASIHENSISLQLVDKHGHTLVMTIPATTRSDRSDMEDRLLSAGVKVSHP